MIDGAVASGAVGGTSRNRVTMFGLTHEVRRINLWSLITTRAIMQTRTHTPVKLIVHAVSVCECMCVCVCPPRSQQTFSVEQLVVKGNNVSPWMVR